MIMDAALYSVFINFSGQTIPPENLRKPDESFQGI